MNNNKHIFYRNDRCIKLGNFRDNMYMKKYFVACRQTVMFNIFVEILFTENTESELK